MVYYESTKSVATGQERLWGRRMISGGLYLFLTGTCYFIAGMINIFVCKFTEVEVIQVIWLLITAIPLIIPQPFVRIDPIWKK
jgi:hypothetical protein